MSRLTYGSNLFPQLPLCGHGARYIFEEKISASAVSCSDLSKDMIEFIIVPPSRQTPIPAQSNNISSHKTSSAVVYRGFNPRQRKLNSDIHRQLFSNQ